MDNFLIPLVLLSLLKLLHRFYDWYCCIGLIIKSIFHRPRSIQAYPQKVPRHLSFLLVPKEHTRVCITTCAQAVDIIAKCCLSSRVEKLSVFIEDSEITEKVEKKWNSFRTDLNDLSVEFISARHAKHLLATTAESLATLHLERNPTRLPPFSLSVAQLDNLIDQQSSSPDVLLVFDPNPPLWSRPLCLFGYPPWQICLTEIHQFRGRVWLPWRKSLHTDLKCCFRNCLDEYDRAEMRFGK